MNERRKNNKSDFDYPVYRRDTDYQELANNDIYLKLTNNLKSLINNKIKNILVFPAIEHIKNRLKNNFPNLNFYTLSERNSETVDEQWLCITNLSSRRGCEEYSSLDFYETLNKIKKNKYLIQDYNHLWDIVKEDSTISILSLNKFSRIESTERLLNCAGFKDVDKKNDYLLEINKRKLINYKLNDESISIKEAKNLQEKQEAHNFFKKYWSNPFNYNYLIEIDEIFAPYSTYFIIKNVEDNKTIAVGRGTWQLPNCFLPLMLAKQRETNLPIKLTNPNIHRYAEIALIYDTKHPNGKKAFYEISKNSILIALQNKIQKIFTTYDTKREHIGTFYKQEFGFKSTNKTLIYGDFGNEWELLYIDLSKAKKYLNFT